MLNDLTHTVVDPHLARPETRATTHEVIRALLAPLTRKNCWTLAEQAAHSTPYRIQHLLNRDQRGVRCLGERGFALLTQRWRLLQHITASPSKIGNIARAALVLTHFERGRLT